jgi:tRNA pseudouridine38-40 synthase
VRTRLRIDLAYAGGSYSGWAIQPGLKTVQEELETALAVALRLERSQVRTVVAGRTDAGVHALGQVCHLDLPEGSELTPAALLSVGRRVQGALQRAPLRIHSIGVAPEGFDARFSPLSRTYDYRIADKSAIKNPLHSAFTVETSYDLDHTEMIRLGASLVGLHDWATFCRPRVGATTIRELKEYRWEREESGVLVATITADAFCHSMVRALVGAAVAVGRGKITHDRVLVLLESKKRTSEFVTMPARGLLLREVTYPDAAELAARAALTRNKRSADPD